MQANSAYNSEAVPHTTSIRLDATNTRSEKQSAIWLT